MDKTVIASVVNSFERCIARGDFFDLFYELFLASSPDVAARFINTDFTRQNEVLRSSLYTMIVAAEMQDLGVAKSNLEKVAARHSQSDLNIGPEMYGLWLECLMRAVKERDPEYTPAIDEGWRQVMAVGIEFMKSRY